MAGASGACPACRHAWRASDSHGVVLISYISDLRSAGLSTADAVRAGCETRLRPVLMTASIAILSLVPMVFARGPGSEVQRPLGVVVIGGLATSTCLTLLVLPILYSWLEEWRNGRLGHPAAAPDSSQSIPV